MKHQTYGPADQTESRTSEISTFVTCKVIPHSAAAAVNQAYNSYYLAAHYQIVEMPLAGTTLLVLSMMAVPPPVICIITYGKNK